MLDLSIQIDSLKKRIDEVNKEINVVNDLITWTDGDARKWDILLERRERLKEMLDFCYNLLGD
jgi:hypothetical protein